MEYSLYNKVKKIVDAKSREEAEALLFGIDGLSINTKEYYQRLVTEFTHKKEKRIYKIGSDIVFDLENNKEEIFNILFLGKYISEHKEGFTKEEFFKAFEDEKERVKIFGKDIENVSLSSIDELKESIRWIQKFKDSFKHNLDGDSYDINYETRKIIINNVGGSFPLTVEVPVTYIEGFNKGNILALQEDKDIEKYVIELTGSLFDELGDNIANYENFFYHISPELLENVLELVNNDIKRLYKLPSGLIMNYNVKVKKLIKKYGLDKVSKLPSDSFYHLGYYHSTSERTKLYNKYGSLAFDILDDNNQRVFDKEDNITQRLIDKYGIDEVAKLPNSIFSLLLEHTVLGKDPNKEEKLFSRLEKMIDKYGIDEVAKLPYMAFSLLLENSLLSENINEQNALIARLEKMIDKYGANKLSGLPNCFFEFRELEDSLFNELIDNFDVEILKKIPDEFTHHIDVLKTLLKKYSIEDIVKLPSGVCYNFDLYKRLIEKYGIEDACKLSNIEDLEFEEADAFIKEYGLEKVSKIPWELIRPIEYFRDLVNKFGLDNLLKFSKEMALSVDYWRDDIIYLIDKYGIDKVSQMENQTLRSYILGDEDTKNFIEKNGIDKTLSVPGLYGFEKASKIIDKYGLEVWNHLPCGVYDFFTDKNIDNIGVLLRSVDNNLDRFKKLPTSAFICDYERLSILHDKYENIETLPSELFYCDSDLFKEMLVKYDNNIMRSIFGINNPKVISTLIYLDSVLSKYDANIYQGSSKDLNRLANIDCHILKNDSKINEKLEAAVDEEHVKFVGLVKSFYKRASDDPELYVNTIAQKYVEGQEKIKTKLGSEINNEVIRHMRNALSHFYFSFDEDWKVRLYDKNDKDEIVFEKRFKVKELKELIEFTHGIEQFLNNDEKPKDLGTIATELNNKHTMDTVNSELVTIIRAFKEKDQLLEQKSVKSK